jgi:hypothetical protein
MFKAAIAYEISPRDFWHLTIWDFLNIKDVKNYNQSNVPDEKEANSIKDFLKFHREKREREKKRAEGIVQ